MQVAHYNGRSIIALRSDCRRKTEATAQAKRDDRRRLEGGGGR